MSRATSLTHWGAFTAEVRDDEIVSVAPFPGDSDPSRLLGNIPGWLRHRARITTPAIRRGWLDDGPGPSAARGADEFVAVDWPELIEVLAGELRRVVDTYGNPAIYGGSYGWASAGRFNHAQGQVHRFLNLLGGYTASRHDCTGAAVLVQVEKFVGPLPPVRAYDPPVRAG